MDKQNVSAAIRKRAHGATTRTAALRQVWGNVARYRAFNASKRDTWRVQSTRRPSHERSSGDGILSGLVSISASYRFTQHWSARVTWNRVVTRYSRDTDVLLGGIGYWF